MRTKSTIFILLIQVFALSSPFAQETDTLAGVELDSLINSGQICFEPVPEDDSVYVFVEQMPEFPGGKHVLYRFLAENFVYPENFNDRDIPYGTIFLKFVVTKSGKVGKVIVERGITPELNNEAVRVVRSLPDFIPGMQNGKPANVWLSVPLNILHY